MKWLIMFVYHRYKNGTTCTKIAVPVLRLPDNAAITTFLNNVERWKKEKAVCGVEVEVNNDGWRKCRLTVIPWKRVELIAEGGVVDEIHD